MWRSRRQPCLRKRLLLRAGLEDPLLRDLRPLPEANLTGMFDFREMLVVELEMGAVRKHRSLPRIVAPNDEIARTYIMNEESSVLRHRPVEIFDADPREPTGRNARGRVERELVTVHPSLRNERFGRLELLFSHLRLVKDREILQLDLIAPRHDLAAASLRSMIVLVWLEGEVVARGRRVVNQVAPLGNDMSGNNTGVLRKNLL